MATVGNLFVNVRGRTSGLVRDLKKANKSVTKDFYRNEAMALQNVRKSRGAFMQAFRATPERKASLRATWQRDEARLSIARRRNDPNSQFGLARLRELRGQQARAERSKAFLASEAKSLIPLIFGVPAAALAFVVRKGVNAFSEASKFAVMGPSGGQFITAKIGKMMDDIAFAQRPDVSATMARSAELERQNAFLWREIGLQWQQLLNSFSEMLGLDIASPKIKGDPGFVPGRPQFDRATQQKIIDADLKRKAGGPIPNYAAGF